MFETDLSDDAARVHVNPLDEHQRRKGDMLFEDAEAETDISVLNSVTYDWVLVCKTHLRKDNEREPVAQKEFPRDIAPRDPMVRQLKLLLHQLSLQVHGFPSERDSSRYFLQITATEDVLLSWAEHMRLQMRLRTKASVLLDKLHDLNMELQRKKRLDRNFEMKDLTKTKSSMTLWVAGLPDGLFKGGAKGSKAVEAALKERFEEFGQVLSVWVRFKHGDASSAGQLDQSWALVTLVPEHLSGHFNEESMEWELDEDGLKMLENVRIDPNAGPSQAAVHDERVEPRPLLIQHQKKDTNLPRKPRKQITQIRAEMTALREQLQSERSKRAHAEFEGMMMFKADLREKFQRNRTRRIAESVFCSGERQRIIRHVLENQTTGFDLTNSKVAKPHDREDVWANMAFEKAEAYAELATADFEGQKVGDVEHETRMHMILNIVVDESRDAGHAPETEKHKAWLNKRMKELNSATMMQLREWTRTWDCIVDFMALHDYHEMEYLRENWVERPVITRVRRSMGFLGHPTSAGAPMRGVLDPRQAIQQLSKQPLNEIRDYFGETTAIYFAFAEHYTASLMWPAQAGLLCVALSAIWTPRTIEGYSFGVAYHVFISIWTVLFIQSWRRQETALSHLWGTEHYKHFETARPQFLALARNPKVTTHHFEFNRLTKTMEPVAKTAWHRYAKMAASMVLLAFFVVLVFGGVLVAQWVKLGDPANPALDTVWKFVGIGLQVVLIGVFGFIYSRLNTATTNWENHRTQSEYNNSLAAKVFVFEAVNNFSVLFFIGFLKGGSTITIFDALNARNATCTSMTISCGEENLHEALQAKCPTTNGTVVGSEEIQVVSCMNELWLQLIVVLSAGQVGKLVLGWAQPNMKYYVKRVEEMHGDIFGHSRLTPVAEQAALPEYKSSIRQQYFSQKAIQFGYVVLFAVVFPYAPVFALVNNWIDIRSSAHILTTEYRRPLFDTVRGIGTWLYVFEAIAMAAVITNATLISFVGGQSADMWASSFTEAGSLEESRYEVLALPGTSQDARLHDEKLWVVAGTTEHVIFFMRIAIAVAIPTTPKWVHIASLQRNRTMLQMKTPQEEQEEQRRRLQLKNTFKKQLKANNLKRRMNGLSLLVDAEERSKLFLQAEAEERSELSTKAKVS